MTRYSILIVDDEANQRLMLEQALRALATDCLVATVASGHEALATMALQPPDLLITDYSMPIMDGLELIAHLRDGHVPIRIILITAFSTPELSAAAQHLAVDHCLTKPVPLSLLRRLATTVLSTTTFKE